MNTLNADGAVNFMMTQSVQRWQKEQGMVDDITIIVAYLNIDPSKQKYNQKPMDSVVN